MRPLFIVGMLLVILGIAAFGYQGVAWFTTQQEVARVGSVQLFQNKDVAIPLAPILGGLGIAAGVVLMLTGASKKTA